MVDNEKAGVWSFPGYPYRIECALSVLEQMNAEVTDAFRSGPKGQFSHAFRSVPRGGAETGGVLYGRHDDSCVRILAAQALKCEHAFGPSFTLSDGDFERLSAALELPKTDPRLAGMEVVGWYHSHTRSDISLTEADHSIHSGFFREPWQIAVVLRPLPLKPTRLGVFYRLADGSIVPDGAPVEFAVAARLRRRSASVDGKERNREPGTIRTEPQDGRMETRPYRRRQSLHRTGLRGRHEAPRRRSPALAAKARPLAADALQDQPQSANPREGRAASPGSGIARWVIIAIALCLGGTAVFHAIHAQRSHREPRLASLSVWSADRGGQLYIAWDRAAAVGAVHGVLQITDGQERKTVAMDRESIETGWIGYPRKSDVVSVSVMLARKDGTKLRGYTDYVPGTRPISRLPDWVPTPPLPAANSIAPANAVPLPRKSPDPVSPPRLPSRQVLKPPRSSSFRLAKGSHTVKSFVHVSKRHAFHPPVTRRSQANWTLPPPAAPEPVLNPIALPAVATAPPPSEHATIAGLWTTRGVRTPRPPRSITTGLGWHGSTGVQDLSPPSLSGSLYQPKAVEVSIFEKGGEIFGNLVGRYRTLKSTGVGPDVAFTFHGVPKGEPMRFPWTGANGTKGEVEFIRLPQSPDAIRIVWYLQGHKPVFDHVLLRMKPK